MKPVFTQGLVDTGFLVSLFDRRQPWHQAARQWLSLHTEPLITVEAVVVETCFFLKGAQRQQFLAAVASGALQVAAADAFMHQRVMALASKYADLDPDYADLAMVWLAEATGCMAILTLDEQDFSVYRVHGRKRFDLIAWK